MPQGGGAYEEIRIQLEIHKLALLWHESFRASGAKSLVDFASAKLHFAEAEHQAEGGRVNANFANNIAIVQK